MGGRPPQGGLVDTSGLRPEAGPSSDLDMAWIRHKKKKKREKYLSMPV